MAGTRDSSRTLQSVEITRAPPVQTRSDVIGVEAVVLARAVEDMDGWIMSLPVASEWHWSFVRSRQVLVDELAERAAAPRSAAMP